MQSYIGRICLAWLHCVFSSVSSKYLDQRRYNRIGYIWFSFSPLCIFMCVLKFPVWYDAYLHWLHLFVFCPLFVSKSLLKVLGPVNENSQSLHLYKCSVFCVLIITLKLYACKDAYSHRSHLFHVSPPCTFKLPFLVEAYAFSWLFSTMCIKTCPQTSFPRGCKVTLIA